VAADHVQKLRVSAERYDAAKAELASADEQRTRAIKRAHEQGSMTVRQIADVLGVSHQLVARLVNR
jgi:Mn-dependent DtxR family transcriptional regulator